jgi:type I restriction enzyme R subunit
MQKFKEDGVQEGMLDWLEEIGWDVYRQEEGRGSSILDKRYSREPEEAVYWDLLKEKIVEINDNVTKAEAKEIERDLKRELTGEDLIETNKQVYEILRNGKLHYVEAEGRKVYVDLVSDELAENSFMSADEYSFRRRQTSASRLDVTLFVNGIPLVQIETKSEAQGNTWTKAYSNMKDYEEDEPRMFSTVLLNAVCDGEKFRYASVGADKKFYFPWRSDSYEEGDYEPEDATKDLFRPETLMDIFNYFVFFTSKEKIVPRYMQYYGTNKIIERVRKSNLINKEFLVQQPGSITAYRSDNLGLDAVESLPGDFWKSESEHPWAFPNFDLIDQPLPRKGLIWHTQGSGKSYTMIFAAYKVKRHPDIRDRQSLIIVDRKKLEGQMEDDLNDIDFPHFSKADTIDDLKNLLEEGQRQLVLTTMQKFEDVPSTLNLELNEAPLIMIDECHRMTEGSLMSNLKAAIPERLRFGFTGTPVKMGKTPKDRNTFREFSPLGENYLHRYSLNQGREDNVITDVSFTSKEPVWDIDEDELDQDFEEEFDNLDDEQKSEVLRKYVNQTELTELRPRIEKVVSEIKQHFEKQVGPNGYKAMTVTPSRRAAVLYADELKKYWDEDEVDAVITTKPEDGSMLKKYGKSDEDETTVVDDFKEKDNNLKMLVVCDKLLTGFDAPILQTMYLDKSMQNHNLLQAIARTNRPMKGKRTGRIVDFQGIFKNPEEALEYEYEFRKDVVRETDELADKYLDKLQSLWEMFDDIDFNGEPEEFRKAINQLVKNDGFANNFVTEFKNAENLYESISPHKKLADDEVETKWAILTQIYTKFRERMSGKDSQKPILQRDDIRANTRRILQKHMDIQGVEEEELDTGIEPVNIKEVEQDEGEDLPPNELLAEQGVPKNKNLESKSGRNPVYSSLSERLKQVINRWKNDDISPEEAVDEYNQLKDRLEKIQEEKENRGMSDSEFAVFKLLVRDYSEFVDDADEASDIAKKIGSKIEERDFNSNIKQLRTDLRKDVLKTLTSEGKANIAAHNNREFLEKSVDYILENGVESP